MSVRLLGISRNCEIVRRWHDRTGSYDGSPDSSSIEAAKPQEALHGGHASACANGAPGASHLAELSGSPTDGAEIRWIEHGDLAAATTAGTPSLDPLGHAGLLADVHRAIDVLPVRFGTLLRDDPAVRLFLDNRHDRFVSDLHRLAGTTELGLRIELPPVPTCVPPADSTPRDGTLPSSTSPAEYLAARRARYDRSDRLDCQAQLAVDLSIQALQGLCQAWRRLSPEPPGVVRLAFLVGRNRLNEFVQNARGIVSADRANAGWTLVGPWPPYSFV